MWVSRFQMRLAVGFVALELQALELRHCCLQNALDSSESPLALGCTGCGNPLQKALTERIVLETPTLNTFRVPQQLWDEVQIDNSGEKIGNRPKIPVAVYLLQ